MSNKTVLLDELREDARVVRKVPCPLCKAPIVGQCWNEVGPMGDKAHPERSSATLCQECGNYARAPIQNNTKLPGEALTSEQVELLFEKGASLLWTYPRDAFSFAAYPRDLLLDELVMCVMRWRSGPLDGDERQIATSLLERLATLGIARKMHHMGCEVWLRGRLCNCPWAPDKIASGAST